MKTNRLITTLALSAALLLSGCGSPARVGELRSESQSVELGDAKSVRVDINMGAGDLQLAGGADKLMEANFTYNVAKLKPEVEYAGGTLVVRQPDAHVMPDLRDITKFRLEWNLHLSDRVPMDLRVNVGAGSSDLQLAGLSLTGLDVTLGAGTYTLDLSGDWARNLDVTIDASAADVSVRLPKGVGTRVEVEDGPRTIQATGLTRDGNVYTNAAYGAAGVTMRVNMKAGISHVNLDVGQ